MHKVDVLEFRVADRVLTQSDPSSGDVVFLGAQGDVAFPFVVVRKIQGPGGTYVDSLEVLDAGGTQVCAREGRFEIDVQSTPETLVTELRDVRFPGPGQYTLRYTVYQDVVANYPFSVLQQDSPAVGVVPGALDAALAKSTIAWLSFDSLPDAHLPKATGRPVKEPRYEAAQVFPIWYGYQEGRVYVLTGPGEQQVPGLLKAASVRLLARSKSKQSKVDDVTCGVERLAKNDEWETTARDLLLGRRLNLRDGDAAIGRWKETCEIVVLTPLPPAMAESAIA
ncbi:MAG: hypothetical protein WDA27_05800 [Actinomycetota bacterium]